MARAFAPERLPDSAWEESLERAWRERKREEGESSAPPRFAALSLTTFFSNFFQDPAASLWREKALELCLESLRRHESFLDSSWVSLLPFKPLCEHLP